ncbi:MAG: rod shape-determining protein [Desulfotomaculales bacterium]
MPVFSADIGVDLGTANVLVFVKGKGVVLNEPSVVAINKESGKIIAVGKEARRMLGRTPGNITAIRPLQDGVIADYEVTERMLRYFIFKVCGRKLFFRPRIMICIPAKVTNVEERAVLQAALQAGAGQAYVIEEPLAAAIGAGLNISEPRGKMVVDIGGGTTDIAVLSLGGIVCSSSLRVGGDKFDEAIARYVRKRFNLVIGERSAEELKISAGTAYPAVTAEKTVEVRGRDALTGLPRSVNISSRDIYEAILEPLEAVIGAVKEVLERTPPELASDVAERGVVLTGGGALLQGIDLALSEETGIPVHVANDPLSCVAVGTGRALGMLHVLKGTNASNMKRLRLSL